MLHDLQPLHLQTAPHYRGYDGQWMSMSKKKKKNALCGTKRHDCIVNGCGKHHRSLRKSNLAFLKHFQQPRQNDLLYFTLGQKKKESMNL